MSPRSSDPTLRAKALLRWYPAEWRARYGDEFCELLVAEIHEKPRCLHRLVDVAAGGLTARLADAALAGTPVNSPRPAQRSLATFGCAIAAFMTVATSMWSQLNIAQSWSQPTTSSTHTAIVIMTVTLFSCLAIVVIGAVPVAWHAAVAACRGRTPAIRRPALLSFAGTVVIIAGGLFFKNGWAGSGPHPWTHPATGLDAAVAFLWASTLAVSAYWAHPAILLSLPISEITWMAVSPLALIAALAGAARTVRRLDLPTRTLRFASYMAKAASVGLGLFIFGTLVWLIDGGPGPSNLFQAGTVDLIGLAIMAITLGLAARSGHRITSPRSITTC